MIENKNLTFKNRLIKIIVDNSSPLLPVETTLAPRTEKLDNIKCVLFDVYGTLFISGAGDISHSTRETKKIDLNTLLDSYGFKVFDKEAGESAEKYFFEFIKLSHEKSRTSGIDHPEVDVVEIWRSVLSKLISERKIKADLTLENISALALGYEVKKNPVWPMPNLAKTLDYISKKGLYMGIVSNAQFFTPLLFETFLKRDLEQLGFQKELLFWSYEHETAKPSSKLFDLASAKLKDKFSLSPEEVLYIGNDMLNDIMPAHNLGFKTALFAGDKRSLRTRENLSECKNIIPSAIITDLLQLCNII